MTWRPGSLSSLAVLLAAGLVAAVGWVHLTAGRLHIEHFGIDHVHHAFMLQRLTTPGGWDSAVMGTFADYPSGSYYPAAALLPLFGGDYLLAIRCATWTAVLWTAAFQFTLLARRMSGAHALAVLLLWQFLCMMGKVANVNHGLIDGPFNYSRLLGGLGLWLGLVCVTTPAEGHRRLLLQALAAAGAAWAVACHTVPGAITLATLGLYAGLQWLEGERRPALTLAGLLAVAAVAVLLGTRGWRYMLAYANNDGTVPSKNLWLMLLWVPTWFFVVGWRWRQAREGVGEPVARGLAAALLMSGLAQGYAAFKWAYDGSCAAYGVKTLFFYTFPFASVLWLIGLEAWLRRRETGAGKAWVTGRGVAVAVTLACLAHLGWNVWVWDHALHAEVRRKDHRGVWAEWVPPREYLPAAILPHLVAARHDGCYYHDPQQPCGAYYGSLVGLGLPIEKSSPCMVHAARDEADRILDEVPAVLLPRSADPHTTFRRPIHVEDAGPYFWLCRPAR